MIDKNVSWFLINSTASSIWDADYDFVYLESYKGGIKSHKNIVMCVSRCCDNNTLRCDVLNIMENENISKAYIKYKGDTNPKLITRNGEEITYGIILGADTNDVVYIKEGISFHFEERQDYWKPKSLSDIKVGMTVEYFNNNKWSSREIKNPSEEWDGFLKLFVKYDKIRIPKNSHTY